MELIPLLGRMAAFSFAAGVNLYATVAIIGLAARFHWVTLPPQFAIFVGAMTGFGIDSFFGRERRAESAVDFVERQPRAEAPTDPRIRLGRRRLGVDQRADGVEEDC